MLIIGIDVVILSAYALLLVLASKVAGIVYGLCQHESDAITVTTLITGAFMVIGYVIMVGILG